MYTNINFGLLALSPQPKTQHFPLWAYAGAKVNSPLKKHKGVNIMFYHKFYRGERANNLRYVDITMERLRGALQAIKELHLHV